ncbi:MAG: glycosyl hydrolase family 28-related protein [Opitutales bacterium]
MSKILESVFTGSIYLLATALLSLQQVHANDGGASVYQELSHISDTQAVVFSGTIGGFPVDTTAGADNAPALQAAIDQVHAQGGGNVFVPSGVYPIQDTVYLWSGVRLVGYGATRPSFLLEASTSGFGNSGNPKYLIHFALEESGGQVEFSDRDSAHAGVINLDFDIETGNAGAVAINNSAAYGTILRNIRFDIGDGLGGVFGISNLIEACSFIGGEWGINTVDNTNWYQNSIIDCTFDGQSESAMIFEESRTTVLRATVRNTKDAVVTCPRGAISYDGIYIADSLFEGISGEVFSVKNYVAPQVQFNVENVQCNVPDARDTGRVTGRYAPAYVENSRITWNYWRPSDIFVVNYLRHGRHSVYPQTDSHYPNWMDRTLMANRNESWPQWEGDGGTFWEILPAPGNYEAWFHSIDDQVAVDSLDPIPSPDLVVPSADHWVSFKTLGGAGDGVTDDSAALQAAIDNGNSHIYFPTGEYLLSETIDLPDNTYLIGLNPAATKFIVADSTAGFGNASAPRALLNTVDGNGSTVGITGIGFDLANNPGIVGIDWDADGSSFIQDVYFGAAAAVDLASESQSGSIWINNSGSGVFKSIFIGDARSAEPLYVSNTIVPGTMYQIGVQHQLEWNVKMENVSNWKIHGLFTESNEPAKDAVAMVLDNVSDILITNLVTNRGRRVWERARGAVVLRNTIANLKIRCMESLGETFPYEIGFVDESNNDEVPYNRLTMLDYSN